MSTTRPLHRVVLRAHQALHLGTGRGAGFSAVTRRHVPGSTLRGALCASWWREHPGSDQADFEARIARVSFGDAVAKSSDGFDQPLPLPVAASLDRRVCKAPRTGCPETGYPWTVVECSVCRGRTEPAKGERVMHGAAVRAATRVALTPSEQARDDMLFERQGLLLNDDTRLVALAAGDIGWLTQPGQVLRIGASGSVAGRVTVAALEPVETPTLALDAGENRTRIELMTPGVYIDEWGFAVDRPTAEDIHWAFRLSEDTQVTVERAFVRWTTASGWHTASNRPKPEDSAVVAHSCYHVVLDVPTSTSVPRVVHDLGLRTAEGYGWASLSTLEALPEFVPVREPERVDA